MGEYSGGAGDVSIGSAGESRVKHCDGRTDGVQRLRSRSQDRPTTLPDEASLVERSTIRLSG